MNKTILAVLGSISGGVVICGTIISLLLHFLVKTLFEGLAVGPSNGFDGLRLSTSIPFWIFGILYIFPGLWGVVSACAQNKCLYVTTSIFSIISMIIVGLIFAVAGLVIVVLVISLDKFSEGCTDDGGRCKCISSPGQDGATPFKSCDYLSTISGIMIGLIIMIVVGWIVMLVECIMAIYYACTRTITPGVVFIPVDQPMVVMDKPGTY